MRDRSTSLFVEASGEVTAHARYFVVLGGVDARDENRNRVRAEIVDEFFGLGADENIRAIKTGDEIREGVRAELFDSVPSFAGDGLVAHCNAQKMFDGMVRIDGGDLVKAIRL